MNDISKLEKVAIFFHKTMTANGLIYEGGKTYNIHKTPGTIDRWLKRGCQLGDPEKALKDPRLPKEESRDEQPASKPSRSRKSKKKVVEQSEEKVENKEE